MEFIRLAGVNEFETVRIRSYQILGKLVAIVKEPDGTFWATEIACKHQNADLTTGRFQGDKVTCARHGWTYDIRSGECLNQSSAPLRRHVLRRVGDELHVSLRALETDSPPPEEDPMPEIVIRGDGG